VEKERLQRMERHELRAVFVDEVNHQRRDILAHNDHIAQQRQQVRQHPPEFLVCA
jgi:hypothetical protein